MPNAGADRPTVAFVWEQFSVYHVDRLEACAAALGERLRIVGIEFASRSRTYAWEPTEGAHGWERYTLFPGAVADDIPWRRKFAAALRQVHRLRARHVFLCNQERPEIMLLLLACWLQGRRSYAMLDAKFDDKPRFIGKELCKPLVYGRFAGGLVAGARHVDYVRFLGMKPGWAEPGYDAVSVARLRAMSGVPLAPAGLPHAERDFLAVARFVPKKDLATALDAFALYRRSGGRRRLILCGSGPLEAALRQQSEDLGVAGHVVFTGFLGAAEVARLIADSLALILPSVEEQWGLVVNEAVGLGAPVLCSDNVGARDSLVRSGVNGFVFEAGNPAGLAAFMQLLSEDADRWTRMSLACRGFAPAGDVSAFVRGVARLVGGGLASAPYLRLLPAELGTA